jgi:bifunctional non-homologous end joining protein LigD
VFRGLREDKVAAEVVLPSISSTRPTGSTTTTKVRAHAAAKHSGADLAGHGLTHADREIDAKSGITKLDLARYYATVSPLILPHLAHRPVALVRAPDGVEGQTFFQKHTEGRQLPGITLLDTRFDPSHAALLVVGDEEALLGAVQMNVVELHTWNATADRIERPDRFVLDLDPGEGVDWPLVQQAVELVRTLLTELELVPFVKTSGGKGLHVVTPLKRLYDWDTAKDFSHQLTDHLARLMPDRFSAISGPKNRAGRIFVDYLRNGRGATTVAAWSARARPGMGVSVPFAWDELADVGGGAHWHLGNVQTRLRVGNASWNGWADAARALGPARRIMAALPL